jgi:hypothetical protein
MAKLNAVFENDKFIYEEIKSTLSSWKSKNFVFILLSRDTNISSAARFRLFDLLRSSG